MEQIVGIYRDISQFIVGILVNETDTHIVLRRALLCSIEKDKNGNGVVPNFFPLTLLTLDPPFHVMGFLKEQSIDFETSFKKEDLLNPNKLEIVDQVKNIYIQNFVGMAQPPVAPSTPPGDNIINLF